MTPTHGIVQSSARYQSGIRTNFIGVSEEETNCQVLTFLFISSQYVALYFLFKFLYFSNSGNKKKNKRPIKTNNFNNFQVFELKRVKERVEGGKGMAGGGLAVGAVHGLDPVLTRQGDDEAECLSMEINAGSHEFLIVTDYGPLIGDGPVRKKSAWKYLSEEVISANMKEMLE